LYKQGFFDQTVHLIRTIGGAVLKPEHLAIFIRVAELASFTKAAEGLALPKASVSGAIQALEAQLHTQLFHRTTRKVQLTQDGQVLYARSLDVLAELDEVMGLFRQEATQITGRLRVDMPHNIGCLVIIPRLPEFLQQHPQLHIELSSTDRLVDVVSEGFDCVLRAGHLQDSLLVARSLGSLRQFNCVSAGYAERFGVPNNLSDLPQHQLVHYVSRFGSKPSGFEFVNQGKLDFIEMPGTITVNNADAYRAACLAGLGIIQVPQVGTKAYLEAGLLVEVLPQHRAEPIPLWLIYPQRRNLSRRMRVFIDWVSELVSEYAASDS
jgi:DNA-binding transcriptional LysR family regulator